MVETEKQKSDPKLYRIYKRFQKKWFPDLPETLVIYWHPCEGDFGEYWVENEIPILRINPLYGLSRGTTEWSVLHEMCHMRLWPKNTTHNAKFQNEMKRLAKAGAFKNIW